MRHLRSSAARMRASSAPPRVGVGRLPLVHDLALRFLELLSIYVCAASPLVVVPLSAAVAAATSCAHVTQMGRIMRKIRPISIIAVLICIRMYFLLVGVRHLTPSRAALVSTVAPVLFVPIGVSPLVGVVALATLTADTAVPRGRHAPLAMIVRAARRANSRVYRNIPRDDDASRADGGVERPADVVADVPPETDNAKLRGAQRRTDGAGRMDSGSVVRTGRKLPATNEERAVTAKRKAEEPARLLRHALAVLSEKKNNGDIARSSNGSRGDGAKSASEQARIGSGASGSHPNSSDTLANTSVETKLKPVSARWSLICVVLVVFANVLGEAVNGISRALIAEVGNSSLIVLGVSVTCLLVQAPFLLLDAAGVVDLVGLVEFEPSESIATRVALLALCSFVIPPFVLRSMEAYKSASMVLSGSPGLSNQSSSSEIRAVFRFTLARLRSIAKLSVELCMFSLAIIPTLHGASLVIELSDDVSFLSIFAALLIFTASWLQARSVFRSDEQYAGESAASRLSARSIIAALAHSMKQALGMVHASSVSTVHVARNFIVQSQANNASWQVLNFFLLQAGMVLLESLYALSTKTWGLILLSADNVVCCIALALGLYTIRRVSNTRAQDVSLRLESLAGFANGILLVYVAVLVVLEAVERCLERGSLEEAQYAHTFSVCVLGVIGNLVGLVFFPPESRRENHNVQSIYLHIWANTFAFVGVAIGAVAPGYPVVGVVAAGAVGLIVSVSAIPLLIRSAKVLLRNRDASPPPRRLTTVAPTLRRVPGVRSVEEARAWTVGDVEVGAVHIVVASNGAQEVVLQAARDALAFAGISRTKAYVEIVDEGGATAVGSAAITRTMHRRTASSGAGDGGELEGLYIQRGSREGGT